MTEYTKKTKSNSNGNLLKTAELFRIAKIKPTQIILFLFLITITVIFEAAAMFILIPVLKIVIESNMTSVYSMKVIGGLIAKIRTGYLSSDYQVMVMLGAAAFGLIVLKNIFEYAGNVKANVIARMFETDLRKSIYKRYLSFGKLYFDKNNSSVLYETLIGYMSGISIVLYESLHMVFMIATALAYLVVMTFISWQLVFICPSLLLIIYVVTDIILKAIVRSSKNYAEHYSALCAKISNALTCIPLVKSYSNEDEELKWFSWSSDNVAKVLIQISKKSRLGMNFQEVSSVGFMLILLIIVAGARNILGSSIAGYLVFFLLLKRFMSQLRGIIEVSLRIAAVKEPIKKILSVFDDEGKYIIKNGSLPFKWLQSEIRIDNLHFAYDEVEVLHGIDLTIRRNMMTALVGHTGSGKSTLINILARFYEIPDGSVMIDGTDIKKFDIKSLHSKMALISQDVVLSNASLRANLLYGIERKVSDAELMDVCCVTELSDFMENLPNKFDTLIGDRGMRLSGGEKQRIAIARAMIKDPDIIIFDEATNALDSSTEAKIRKAIEKLVEGKTSIFIAHRLSTIKHADNIVVLEGGRIVEQGRMEELIDKKGAFYKYWEHQEFYK